ncbi:MAG: ATP synthase F0 subunit C [Deltaproteobacteria bacterium]|uniref:ATP synthase subunit c n=1 Tax=Candidatus Zymogenus saltonus TaxID=2844893 RepID=A0A9D8KH25_9DELT|nr:ATP synthase F0 subunit C [Candidatus Zymogenus saltonus]
MSKKLIVTLFFVLMVATAALAFAQDHAEEAVEVKLLAAEYVPFFVAVVFAAAAAMGLGSFGTGIGMGNAVRGAVDGVSRNPDAFGRILTTMMIGLAMIESLAIYALIVALVLIFANPFLRLFGAILG